MNASTPIPTTLLQDLRSLPGQYWILFGGTLVNRFGHFVIPFLAIYLRQKGSDAEAVGLVLGGYGAGCLVAGFVGGYLADRIGRKPTMLISCASAALFMLLLSQAESIGAMTLLTFMTGLTAAMYSPAASAFIADLVPPVLRVRAFSCQRLAINLGFAFGMATAGFMARQSFMTLFVVDAATTLFLAVVILVGLKPRAVIRTAGHGWSHALKHMGANRAFLLAVVSTFLTTVVFWQMSSSYGLQITEGARLDERAYGMLLALNGIMIAFIELPLTSVTRRFRPVHAMAAGYVLLGIGMGLNGMGASLFLLVTSMVVFTLGEMIALPVSNSYMAGLAPDEMRGRYQGVMSMAWAGGTMVGPSMGVALYHWSPVYLWMIIMGISFTAAVMILATNAISPPRQDRI